MKKNFPTDFVIFFLKNKSLFIKGCALSNEQMILFFKKKPFRLFSKFMIFSFLMSFELIIQFLP